MSERKVMFMVTFHHTIIYNTNTKLASNKEKGEAEG